MAAGRARETDPAARIALKRDHARRRSAGSRSDSAQRAASTAGVGAGIAMGEEERGVRSRAGTRTAYYGVPTRNVNVADR